MHMDFSRGKQMQPLQYDQHVNATQQCVELHQVQYLNQNCRSKRCCCFKWQGVIQAYKRSGKVRVAR